LTEQLLDTKGSFRLVRRSWRLVAVIALVGVLAAGGYVLSSLPRYVASSLVLLPSASTPQATSSSTVRPVTTDARIATSAAVLVPAGKTADPSADLSQLQKEVRASPITTGVLKVSATATTRRAAERLANAVASRLVVFLTTNGTAADASMVAGLDAEQRQLQNQLTVVKDQITATTTRLANEDASSAAGKQDSTLLANLKAQETAINLQLSTVKTQITTAESGQTSANEGTEVLQRATSATPPSKLSLALPVVAGLLAGVLVGAVLVLARNRSHPRLRTRDALAEALGAPVVLSLDVGARRTLGDWVSLFERHEPGSLELWSVLKALRELGLARGDTLDLVVLAFADDGPAVAQTAHLAVAAADSGVSTELCVLAGDGDQRALHAVCTSYTADGRSPRGGLTVRNGSPTGLRKRAELSLTVIVTDVADPSAVTLRPRGVCVVSISSGFATARALARVGIAASESGAPISAVCVANPDPRDETVGRFSGRMRTRSQAEGIGQDVQHRGAVTVERTR
jgi:capsular polysaccharide biosynthesis protein